MLLRDAWLRLWLRRLHCRPTAAHLSTLAPLRAHILGECWLGNTGMAGSVVAAEPVRVPLFEPHAMQSVDAGWCVRVRACK